MEAKIVIRHVKITRGVDEQMACLHGRWLGSSSAREVYTMARHELREPMTLWTKTLAWPCTFEVNN